MFQDNMDYCPPDYYKLEDGTIRFYTQFGEITQDLSPKIIEEYPRDHSKLRTSDQWIWTTKEGKELFVKDMDTNHIKNCIKMIYKKNGAVNCFAAFIGELIKRGEI